MKTLILALVATIAGCAIGFTLTVWDLTSVGNVGLGSPVDVLELGSSNLPVPEKGIPRLEIEGEPSYDFGVMERGQTLSHAFVVRNEGRGPLSLTAGETTCKCTVSELTNGHLEPGESTEITLEWTPKEYEPVFSQSAEIRTNDPLMPILSLSVRGRIVQSVRAEPMGLTLGSVSLNKPTAAELKLYNYADESLEVESIQWAREDIAEFFSAEVVDMPADMVAEDPDAKGGKLVKIQIESGLPLGPINQKIRLATNFTQLPDIEVSLNMTVTGDVSVVGYGYTNSNATLTLGRIRSAEGYLAKLNVLVKGEHREGTEITVGEVKPADILQVSLGEMKSVKDGAILMIPLEVTVPAGARSANHIGAKPSEQGTIVLETSHPDAKQIKISVRFAVE